MYIEQLLQSTHTYVEATQIVSSARCGVKQFPTKFDTTTL